MSLSPPVEPSPTPWLPPLEQAYLDQVVRLLKTTLRDDLVGVYLFGSASHPSSCEGYEPGASDLDVQAITLTSPTAQTLQDITRNLSYKNLPCPAIKLEFVLYTQAALDVARRAERGSSGAPPFVLNFNTGRSMTQDVVEISEVTSTTRPSASHWFLLDLASSHSSAVALLGPPAQTVFPLPSRSATLEALLESVKWHRVHELDSPNTIMNAARGVRYAAEGVWCTKKEGIEWAIGRYEKISGQEAAVRLLEEVLRARKESTKVLNKEQGVEERFWELAEWKIGKAMMGGRGGG
ncbi:BQ2448_1027 [Microbotryum intermedium]|uniref:BQ2448_1027 protein n=1 Tax=Microbotryum intermedium TaxID=269621 RepID=A0A238FCU0_9BASI|nr:BQ2448_1027 [Microbotryum intermedium]